MPAYILFFNDSGNTREDIHVPAGKRVYLVRDERVSQGTATVRDFRTGKEYTIPNGVTAYDIGIAGKAEVSLAFTRRSNPAIDSVNVEVTSPR